MFKKTNSIFIQGKEVNAAIFDMDGTMFDTERLRINMIKQASREIVGEAMNDDLLLDSLGINFKAAEELAKNKYGEDYPYLKIRNRADKLEVEYVEKNGIPIKKGLVELLAEFKGIGIPVAIATSSKRDIVEKYIKIAGLEKFFDKIICGDEVSKSKPDPEIFLKAADNLGKDIKKCLIFEDSENGLLAAQLSNGIPVFVKDIKEPRKEIKEKVFISTDSLKEFSEELSKSTKKTIDTTY